MFWFLIMGPVRSSTSWTPWGVLQLFKHASNYFPTRYPFTPGLKSVHTDEMPCPRTPRHTTATETFRSRLQPLATTPHPACMYMEYIFRYRATEGGHCQGDCRPQWFFYTPLNFSETALPFTWSCEPRKIRSLQYWRARYKSPQAYLVMGIKPRPLAWRACTLPLRYCACTTRS